MPDIPRSEQKRYDDPDLEQRFANWRRWRIGDDDGDVGVGPIESSLNPDRIASPGAGTYQKAIYRQTFVPLLLGDAITIEEAIFGNGRDASGIPSEYAQCLTHAYLKPRMSDDKRAVACGYGSRQTYYRRLDDAKIMVRSRLYGQQRAAVKNRAAWDEAHGNASS